MRKRTLFQTWLGLAAMSVIVAGCDFKPPTQASQVSNAHPRVSVQIAGPDAIEPGQAAQYTADIKVANGPGKAPEITRVEWRSTDASVLQVTNTGAGTAGQRGEAIISVDVTAPDGKVIHVAKEVLVLPAGTYRLTGTVFDVEFHGLAVSGATVEATPGSIATTTDANGKYKLYGVPADSTIHVRAEGYRDVEEPVHLNKNGAATFQMQRTEPADSLNGNYTLTFDVTNGCSNDWGMPSLPQELRHRVYDAVLTRNGQNVDVTLPDPKFAFDFGAGNHFMGFVSGSFATFTIDDGSDYGGGPDLAEKLANDTFLVTQGRAITTLTKTGWTGQMTGAPTTGFSGMINVTSTYSFLSGCFNAVRLTLAPKETASSSRRSR